MGNGQSERNGRRKIILIDDEWHNIDDLEVAVDGVLNQMKLHRHREYAAHGGEAVDKLKESMLKGDGYAAIICDNHMKGEFDDGIHGDDLLRILTGNPLWCFSQDKADLDVDLSRFDSFREMQRYAVGHINEENEILDFLESNFESVVEYRMLVDYHFGHVRPVVAMLCGQPDGVQREGLDSVAVFQKPQMWGKNGQRLLCERQVLYHLVDNGVFPIDAVNTALGYHPRLSDDAHPTRALYRKPVKPKNNARKK